MSAPPRVAVVVAAYNAEATLAACLQSLLELDYPEDRLELICVDNDSSDRTGEIAGRFRRVVGLHESARGAGAARNCGLRHTRAEVVAFTDADCTVSRGWLRHLVAPLDDRKVGIVGGRILAPPGANFIERFGDSIHDHHKAINVFRPPYVISMNWASPRVVLEECDGFDAGLLRGQDVDLAYRIGNRGYRLVYAPEAIIHHRNERTLWGLFHEGYTHGYHAHRVRAQHPQLKRAGDQVAIILQRLKRSQEMVEANAPTSQRLCALVFTVGKVVGELHGLRQAATP